MRKSLLLLSFLFVLMSQVGWAASKKGSAIEGKVINIDNKPLGGIAVIAEKLEPLKGYTRLEAKTKTDGTFTLKGLYPRSEYRLYAQGGQCNNTSISIISAPDEETTMLKDSIELRFDPFKMDAHGVLTDNLTNLEIFIPTLKGVTFEKANEMVSALTVNGGEWRLPSISELQGLYKTAKRGCGLQKYFCKDFVGLTCSVWSSNTCVQGGTLKSGAYTLTNHGSDDYCKRNDEVFSDDTRVIAVRSIKK